MQACYGPQKEDLLRQKHISTMNAWNGLTLIRRQSTVLNEVLQEIKTILKSALDWAQVEQVASNTSYPSRF